MVFVVTSSDPRIFTKGTNVIILYVDDCITMSRMKDNPDELFAELTRKYNLTDKGMMEEYLGVLINHIEDKSYIMLQPFLIELIISVVPSITDTRSTKYSACLSTTLTKDDGSKPRKEH